MKGLLSRVTRETTWNGQEIGFHVWIRIEAVENVAVDLENSFIRSFPKAREGNETASE